MSIHNFIKNYQSPFTMESHFCHHDGILWINADSLWTKQNRSKKAFEIKKLVFHINRKLNHDTRKYELELKKLTKYIETPLYTLP